MPTPLCEYCIRSATTVVTSRYARACIPLSVSVCWEHERDLYDQGDGVSRRSRPLRRATVPQEASEPAALPLPPVPVRSSVLALVATLQPDQIPKPYVKPDILTERL